MQLVWRSEAGAVTDDISSNSYPCGLSIHSCLIKTSSRTSVFLDAMKNGASPWLFSKGSLVGRECQLGNQDGMNISGGQSDLDIEYSGPRVVQIVSSCLLSSIMAVSPNDGPQKWILSNPDVDRNPEQRQDLALQKSCLSGLCSPFRRSHFLSSSRFVSFEPTVPTGSSWPRFGDATAPTQGSLN